MSEWVQYLLVTKVNSSPKRVLTLDVVVMVVMRGRNKSLKGG